MGVVCRCLVRAVLAFAFSAGATFAHAQAPGDVDAGWARYREADFAGALEAFDAAEAGEGLSPASLARLLEGRALVRFAQGDQAAMEAALRRLANLDPQHALGDDAPPEVARAFLAARRDVGGPVRLEVEVWPEPAGARVRARVTGDATGLALGVRLRARVDGEEAWREGGEELLLPRVDGPVRFIEVVATALGPGGAPLAREGTEERPARFDLAAGAGAGPIVGAGPDDPLTGGMPPARRRRVIGGALGAAAAVLLVALAIGLSRGETRTQPTAPVVVELRP